MAISSALLRGDAIDEQRAKAGAIEQCALAERERCAPSWPGAWQRDGVPLRIERLLFSEIQKIIRRTERARRR